MSHLDKFNEIRAAFRGAETAAEVKRLSDKYRPEVIALRDIGRKDLATILANLKAYKLKEWK